MITILVSNWIIFEKSVCCNISRTFGGYNDITSQTTLEVPEHSRTESDQQHYVTAFGGVPYELGENQSKAIYQQRFEQQKQMWQSVGMTIRQVKKMLVLESLCYTITTIILTLFSSITIIPLISNGVTKVIGMKYFSYHYNPTSLFIVYLFLILLSLIIPLKGYKSLIKERLTSNLKY